MLKTMVDKLHNAGVNVALTTTFESGSPSSEISFDCMLVFAIFIKISSSSGFTVFAMPCSNSNVFLLVNPSTITDEWTFLLSKSSAFSRQIPLMRLFHRPPRYLPSLKFQPSFLPQDAVRLSLLVLSHHRLLL